MSLELTEYRIVDNILGIPIEPSTVPMQNDSFLMFDAATHRIHFTEPEAEGPSPDTQYLKLDGTNVPTANINMNSHKIVNVTNPTAAQDAATKDYVDTSTNAIITSLPASYLLLNGTNAMLAPLNMNTHRIENVANPIYDKDAINLESAAGIVAMRANPGMSANTTEVDGLTYRCEASSEAFPGYPIWKAFQPRTDYEQIWASGSNTNEWIQMVYPYPIAMKGFSIIVRHGSVTNTVSSWKVQASDDNVTFTEIVPTNTTVFPAATMKTFMFPNTTFPRYHIWRFHMNELNGGIHTLYWIPVVEDPRLRKCLTSYIPPLNRNEDFAGFEVSASSEKNSDHRAYRAFTQMPTPGIEWATDNEHKNFWIKCRFPEEVRIWKVGLTSKQDNTEQTYSWELQVSNNNTTWFVFYSSTQYLGSTYEEFIADTIVPFKYFRFFGREAWPVNPGMSLIKVFVYDK